MDVKINILAVLLSTVASMLIGFVWYSPKVFGNSWLKLAKLDPKRTNMGKAMGAAVISSAIMAYVLAHVSYLSNNFFKNSFMQDSLTTAFWMWLGFQLFRTLQRDAFGQVKEKETLIHVGNDLATIMAMGLIIGLMGL
jgi:cation transport ATPase